MNKKDNKETTNQDGITRRSFFKRIWIWLGVVAGLEFAGLSLSFLFSGKRRVGTKDLNLVKVIGRVEDIKPGSVYPYRSGQLYLVRMTDGGFLALSLKCTHLGCSISWNEDDEKFICPCHSSEFDRYGDVLSPPAPHALDAYEVIIEEGMLKVDLGKKVKRRKFEKTDLTYG